MRGGVQANGPETQTQRTKRSVQVVWQHALTENTKHIIAQHMVWPNAQTHRTKHLSEQQVVCLEVQGE